MGTFKKTLLTLAVALVGFFAWMVLSNIVRDHICREVKGSVSVLKVGVDKE